MVKDCWLIHIVCRRRPSLILWPPVIWKFYATQNFGVCHFCSSETVDFTSCSVVIIKIKITEAVKDCWLIHTFCRRRRQCRRPSPFLWPPVISKFYATQNFGVCHFCSSETVDFTSCSVVIIKIRITEAVKDCWLIHTACRRRRQCRRPSPILWPPVIWKFYATQNFGVCHFCSFKTVDFTTICSCFMGES